MVAESSELFELNCKELDFFGLSEDINIELYLQLESLGRLLSYTLRKDNKVVGYSTYITGKHLQHKELLQARQDALYVKPEYRSHGLAFIRYCERQLRSVGVSFIFRSSTTKKDWSSVLKRMDYVEVETIYMKDLRGRDELSQRSIC
jgi:GNAT superfamily N-acetyltransferase